MVLNVCARMWSLGSFFNLLINTVGIAPPAISEYGAGPPERQDSSGYGRVTTLDWSQVANLHNNDRRLINVQQLGQSKKWRRLWECGGCFDRRSSSVWLWVGNLTHIIIIIIIGL
jgi:hypothetical protein